MSSGDPRQAVEATQEHEPSVRNDVDETVAPGSTQKNSSAPSFGPPADPSELGVIGPYRIVKELGRGGMGAVYAAVDVRLDRRLALKIMLPQFAADPAAKERFLREARATAQITHDNVVTVYEADERDGVPYIAMQFLEGCPLDEFLKRKGGPTLPQIVRIARETTAGLAAAHRIGLVHRDVKPGNLWLEAPNGRVKVLDFGLARPVDADVELTKSGAVVGTPAYMSPEQARGEKVDHRTDLFSLGVVMYRLCTGRLPFEAPNTMAVLMRLGSEDPTPVRSANPKVPEPVAALIHQLLSKTPGDRPQSADEVLKRLRMLGDGSVATPAVDSSPAPKSNAAPIQVTTASSDNPFAEITALQSSPSKEPSSGSSPFPRLKRPKASPPEPLTRRPWIAIAAGFLLPAIIGGVIIIIKHKDGSETRIEAADKSKVTIEEKDGKTTVHIESGAKPNVSFPSALQFDGVDDNVRLPVVYDGSYPLTVEAWVSPTRSTGGVRRGVWQGLQAIVANVEKGGVTLGLDQSGRPYAAFNTGESGEGFANGYAMATAPEPIVLNSWTHLAAVFAAKETRLYVAGRRAAAVKLSKPHFASDLPFIVGGDPRPPDKTSYHLAGAVAGVRFSKSERYKADFTPAARFDSEAESLALYRFDEGAGDALKDSSGNNQHGKIVGATWIQAHASADADRKAADWALSLGGDVEVTAAGKTTKADAKGRLPEQSFDLIGVNLNSIKNLNDDALAPFDRCRRIRRVNLGNSKVGDAGLAHFQQCKESLWEVGLHATQVTDEGLKSLSGAKHLTHLYLGETNVGDKGLERLKDCTSLVFLFLSGTSVTDAGIGSLSPSTPLNGIHLERTGIGDDSLKRLADFPSLREIHLRKTKASPNGVAALQEALPYCRIVHDGGTIEPKLDLDRKAAEWALSIGGFVKTDPQERGASTAADLPKTPFKLTRVNLMSTKTADVDLKILAGLDRLNSLDLYGCKITDDGLDHLRGLAGLDALNLHNTKITNAGLAKLAPFKNLTWLKLNQTQVTDAGLAALHAHARLVFLELELLPVTDAGLVHLSGLKSLKHLSLKGTKCSESGVMKLAESLPACKIVCDAGTIGPKR